MFEYVRLAFPKGKAGLTFWEGLGYEYVRPVLHI